MTSDLPPIVKAAERLLAEIERAVRAFARIDRNSIGTMLRNQAMDLCRLCNRAWRDHARQLDWTNRLIWVIDEIKTSMRLGKDVHAFRSFKQFEHLIRLAEDLGRQAGGWKRQQEQHPQRQNAMRHQPASQRAQTLGTRTASAHAGANP